MITKQFISLALASSVLLACPRSMADGPNDKAIAAAAIAASQANNGSRIPLELQDVGIREKLGEVVGVRGLTFKDETGRSVQLSQFFGSKKPVLLTLVYYECPNLCNFMLNGLLETLKTTNWSVGNQFEIVSVSINPKETPELAAKKKAAYLAALGRPGAENGWHFLTGEEPQIRKLASQLGFSYKYVPEDKQYAHSAAIFVLTPEAKISRYLYGISFPEKDLKLSLLEASNGKIGTIVDRFLLFCYQYNPHTRKYSVVLSNIMRAASVGTVLVFGSYLAVFWRRQRKSRV